jgi:hypothetical protein
VKVVWMPERPATLPEDWRRALSVLRSNAECVQAAHVLLLRPLLFHPASAVTSVPRILQSPSIAPTAFHAVCLHLVRKNIGVLRQVPPPGLSSNSVLVNVFFVVLWFLGPAMTSGPAAAAGSPPPSPRKGRSGESHKSQASPRAQSSPCAPSVTSPHSAAHSPCGFVPGVRAGMLQVPRSGGYGGVAPNADDAGPSTAADMGQQCSLWQFPAAQLLVPEHEAVDTTREHYLGLSWRPSEGSLERAIRGS